MNDRWLIIIQYIYYVIIHKSFFFSYESDKVD